MTFNSSKDQRIHYKSDIHRFNLKRKVVDLPPVTPEVFEQKVKSLTTKFITSKPSKNTMR